MPGRLSLMRKYITDQCTGISFEDRATFIRSMNNKDPPSRRRFKMKNEGEVDKLQRRGKVMEQMTSRFTTCKILR